MVARAWERVEGKKLGINAHLRTGMPVFDRLGAHQKMWVGYRGTLNLLFEVANIFRTARYIPAVEYINANRYRSELNKAVQEFMKDYDVVIVPTFGGNQLAITNLTGNPSICFPTGFSPSGSPQSITLVGKLYGDAAILQLAKAYQDKTSHNKKHPLLFVSK